MIYLALGEPVRRISFSGPGTQAPFSAACYPRPGGAGEVVDDILELGLEGSPSALQEGLAAIERWLEAARQITAGVAGEGVRLYLTEADGEVCFCSPVLDGWVERLKGQRASRSMAVRLHLKRLNFWEDPAETWLMLSNLHGQGETVLRVDNHSGEQHCNFVDILPAEGCGDLPMPVTLRLENSFSGSSLGAVYVYKQTCRGSEAEPFSGWLEGEAASGGILVNAADASGGAYALLGWSGVDEAVLCSWVMPSAELFLAGGKFFQPLLRFQAAPEEDTRLRMRLSDGSFILWEGAASSIRIGQQLQVLSSLQLPPQRMVLDPLKPLTLSLIARCSQAGSHSLQLDALQLAPLDGWRKLLPLAAGVPEGAALVDDNRRGCVYQSSPFNQGDYWSMGQPLLLEVGVSTWLVFFQMGVSGQAEINRTMEVSLSGCRRYRRV